jgi:uncharacterized protein YdgA (DUF945 family)
MATRSRSRKSGHKDRAEPRKASSGSVSARTIVRAAAAVLLLAVIAAAALPWWLGSQIASTLPQTARAAATHAGLSVKEFSYHRGWFTSTADSTLATHSATPILIVAHYEIEHGPIPLHSWQRAPALAVIHAQYSVRAGDKTPPKLAKQIATIPPATLEASVDLQGDASGTIAIEGGKRSSGDKSVAWAPVTGQIAFDTAWTRLKMSIAAPSLQIISGGSKIRFAKMALATDLNKGSTGTMVGTSRFSLGSVSVPGLAEFKGIQNSSRSRIVDKLLSVEFEWKLADATIAGKHYGPADAEATLKRIDAAALHKFQQDMNATYSRTLPPEQAQMIVFGKALVLAGALSRRNPEFDLSKFQLKTEFGPISGNARLAVDGSSQDIGANPMLLLTAVEGNAQLSVPEAAFRALIKARIQKDVELLRQSGNLTQGEEKQLTPEALTAITDAAYPAYLKDSGLQRFFQLDGDAYRFRMKMEKGRITINGTPINPVAVSRPSK